MRQVQIQIAAGLSIAAAAFTAMTTAAAYGRTAVQRDVEGYAIASCLVAQDQPYLKLQGDGWASTIIQRGKGGLGALAAVTAAVKAELAKGDMPVIHNETEMKDIPLPVMYCGEIIDAPSVHAAIEKAAKRLVPAYRAR